MNKVNIGIVGTGWCGGIRAEACAASPYVSELHIAEIKEERLKEVAQKTKPVTATTDYRTLLENRNINSIIISATPETTHFPMAKESLLAGKHVFLEKPIALELSEADELIAPILSVIPMQLLAYYIGVAKGYDVDKPRNLAKSLTVM